MELIGSNAGEHELAKSVLGFANSWGILQFAGWQKFLFGDEHSRVMFSPDEFEKRIASFPRRYMANFDYVWKWKIKVESNDSAHILDENHRREAYNRLSSILPKWQTYRNGDNPEPLKALRETLNNISEEYNQLRKYTLLEFESIPHEILEKIWHELGRVKEKDGNRNKHGYYSTISISKPLLLIWGQTPAFDSFVRKHIPTDYNIPKYSCKWNLDAWTRIMKQFSMRLSGNEVTIKHLNEESKKLYGEKTVVPYGRFLDIYYWEGQ